MSKSDAGKGDTYRPVNKELYDKNYDRIFGRFVCAQLVCCDKCENTSCVRKKKDGKLDRVQEDSQQVCNVGSKDKTQETDEKSKQDDVQGSNEAGIS